MPFVYFTFNQILYCQSIVIVRVCVYNFCSEFEKFILTWLNSEINNRSSFTFYMRLRNSFMHCHCCYLGHWLVETSFAMLALFAQRMKMLMSAQRQRSHSNQLELVYVFTAHVSCSSCTMLCTRFMSFTLADH